MLQPTKALNNNVLLGRETATGREVVIVGRGIGFQAAGRPLDPGDSRIEKVFFFLEDGRRQQFLQLLEIVDDQIVGVTEEIIGMLAREFGREVNEHLHVALPDHLAFAVERHKQGMDLPNPFLGQIQTLYPEEFRLADQALALLHERLGHELPESEQGFLALHFYAARQDRPASSVARHNALITEIVQHLRSRIGTDLPEGVAAYSRLVVHLRHALESIEAGREPVNPLLGRIIEEFPLAYGLAKEIGDLIAERLGKRPCEAEIGYLAIHLIKLMYTGPI